jgi:hypothetical protein
MIISFSRRFQLAEVANEALVKLLRILLPQKNNLKKTFDAIIKQQEMNLGNAIKILSFCNNCGNECKVPTCEYCEIIAKKTTFHYIDFEPQLKSLISLFGNDIVNTFTEERPIKDLLDGKTYKKDENILSLMLYTDGITLDQKKKKTIWPLICGLVELPPMLRDSVKNKIICGVWNGEIETDFDFILSDFAAKIKKWSNEGLKVSINGKEKIFQIRVYGLICDSPAKAAVLCIKKHAGYFSCPFCYIEGKN